MRILVVGVRQLDAGKTTFTRGLVSATGLRAYKPRAGNDRWYDHDAYRKTLDEGLLVGKDTRLLARAQPDASSLKYINPIHRLWGPSFEPAGGMHDRPYREFLVDRAGETHVVNATVELPAELRRALPLEGAVEVTSIREMNEVVEEHYIPLLERWEAQVATENGLVVESYGDIAAPVQTLSFDIVAAVEPGRVRYFDGNRYEEACKNIPRRAREGTMEPIVEDVIAGLSSLETVDLPPLTGAARKSPADIARAYREAYEVAWDHLGTRA